MAPHARWLLLPLALGLCLIAVAQERRTEVAAGPNGSYHREYSTAVRQDPPPAARAPVWGSWCDGASACPDWGHGDGTPVPQEQRWWAGDGQQRGHRPDPNLRRVEVPGRAEPRGWSGPAPWWQDGTSSGSPADWGSWREPDDRARRGWRAGWRGAAPGLGGVWWYGWGDDWPAYAGAWQPGWGATRWSGWQGDGGSHGYVQFGYGHGGGGHWHGDIQYGQGWNAGRWHGEFGFGQGWTDGPRVIALPAPRGE